MKALFGAIEKGDLELVKKLSSTIDINKKDSGGYTPLAVAVATAILNPEGMDILEYLLEKGADPNIADNDGYTPLFIAAYSGYSKVFTTLLKYGGNPNYLLTESGAVSPSIPLRMVGMVLGAVDSYNAKSENSSTSKSNSIESLFKAIKQGDLESVKKLSSGIDINQKGQGGFTALGISVAIKPINMDIVRYLLEKGADPNIRDNEGYTPLFIATYSNDSTAFQTLLKAGGNPKYLITNSGAVNPDIPGRMRKEVIKAVKEYKENDSTSTPNSIESLFEAIEKGDLQGVKALVSDVNEKDSKTGWTPLAIAARHSANPQGMDILRYLIEQGADPNIADKNGYTPLNVAIAYLYEKPQKGSNILNKSAPESISYLLNHGARPNQKIRSPLLYLAEQISIIDEQERYFSALVELVDHGAKIDPDALTLVYKNGDKTYAQKVAKYLISKGTQPTKDFLDNIIKKGDYDLIDYFLDKGAFGDSTVNSVIRYLDVPRIEKFLLQNPDSVKYPAPLSLAVQFRDPYIVKLLVDRGANPTQIPDLVSIAHPRNKDILLQLIKEYHQKAVKRSEDVSSFRHLYDVLRKNEAAIRRADNSNQEVLQIVTNDMRKIGFQVLNNPEEGYPDGPNRPILNDSNAPERVYPSNLEEILGQGPSASVLSKSTLTRPQEEELYRFWRKISMYVFNTGIDILLHPRDLVWLETNTWALNRCRIALYKPKFISTLGLKNGEIFLQLEKGQNINKTYSVQYLNDGLQITSASGVFSSPIAYYVNYAEALKSVNSRCDESIKLALRQSDEKSVSQALFFLKLVPFTSKMIDLIAGNVALSQAVCDTFDFCILEAKKDKERKQQEKATYKRDNKRENSPKVDKVDIIENTRVIATLRTDTDRYHGVLSSEYRRAIDRYTKTAYRDMNECLRESNSSLDCGDETKDLIVTLDKALSNPDAPKLKEALTVYRGIDADSLQARSVAEALKKLVPGSYWEDRGFVSTSVQHPPSGFVGQTCCIMEISLPPGTHAYYIGKNSSVSHEEEVILLPGILLKYVGRREKGTKYRGDRTVTTYLFECAGCTPNTRFAISHAPEELNITTKRLSQQPQDLTVGTDRLSLFNLLSYNKFLPEIWKENRKDYLALRVCTFNVHEFRNKQGQVTRDAMRDMITKIQPDVLGIQEATGANLFKTDTYSPSSCNADSGSYGEVLRNDIIVRKNIEIFFNQPVALMHERCMVVIGIKVRGIPILIGNLHLDVSSSDNRLENINHATEAMGEYAKRYGVKNVIIMGDFNSYSRRDYDTNNFEILKEIRKGRSMEIFEAIEHMERQGYQDTFGLKKVLPPKNTNYYGGRIDFIFLGKDFDLKLLGTYAYYTGLSDHIAIVADFRLV